MADDTPETPDTPRGTGLARLTRLPAALWQWWVREWRRWRKVRRRTILIVFILSLPVDWSYYRALTGPGSDSFQARTVEWARDNHLGWVVDRTEKWWYDHHQAKVGGTPDLANAPAVIPAAPSSTSTVPESTVPDSTLAPAPTHLTKPEALVSPTGSPVGQEGQWAPFGPAVNGVQGAYLTSIRPDNVHTSILDAVIWFDPTVLRMRQYPGEKIPGGPWDRPPYVERTAQQQLVAAFSGGFRIQDSNGGMILGHRTLRTMRTGGATFAISADGIPNIGAWGTDIVDTPTLDSARQNLDLIVIDSKPNPALATDPNRQWGFTGPDNRSAVWRSGAGIRADGSLIWVGGNGLTIATLADTLIRAGAVRGMQLDINKEWVQLNTYAADATGKVHGRKLLSAMQHTGDRWLSTDTRDFIAVFVRTN